MTGNAAHICPGLPPGVSPAHEQLDHKRLATLTAQCALVGVQLHALEDDRGRPTLLVTKWALTRSFATIDEAEQWVERFAGVRTERAASA